MSHNPPAALRVGVIMNPKDVLAMDRAAEAEGHSRSSWARRVLKARLREIEAATKGTETL